MGNEQKVVDYYSPKNVLEMFIISILNANREAYLKTNDKKYWWQMIQLLPSSYNQKRTVMLNYEVLANMYKSRKTHKLDEWREFCKWMESLPYSDLICGDDRVIRKLSDGLKDPSPVIRESMDEIHEYGIDEAKKFFGLNEDNV